MLFREYSEISKLQLDLSRGAALEEVSMKLLGKVAAIVLMVIVPILVVGITMTVGWRPFIGPKARALTNTTYERTPARAKRGKYLVEAVTQCMECHAPHDWTQHDSPITPGMLGAGGGLSGRVIPPNLTPDPETGSGNWSDDQLARAIREGIGHDGRALNPLMPYVYFSRLADEDVASIVVYLRSLPPVRHSWPKNTITFPINYLTKSLPQPITHPVPLPDFSDPVRRGAYLVTVAHCTRCHTPQQKRGRFQAMGEPIRGLEFGGGVAVNGPWGRVASANLTPDPSGISYYDEGLFIQTLRTGFVKARKINQYMPWTNFRNMTDEDLKAIFAYLRTLPPVRHHVDNTEPPTYCRECGATHGWGEKNKALGKTNAG
jgi:mono/diheme cytochrome c family protein